MNKEILHWLRSPQGQSLLAAVAQCTLTDTTLLQELTRLREHYPAEQVRVAVEQIRLRRRAREKFSQAEQLYFTREALEQATGEVIASYRATRFAQYHSIADVCCGIGGDALALAMAGRYVTAIDKDAGRLALLAANAEILGLQERITVQQADVLVEPPSAYEAIFCDPGRRAGGKRRFRVEEYEPPLSHVLGWRAYTPALAVKISPGVGTDELTEVGLHEQEFLSLNGELKEMILWCGPLVTTHRRATLLHVDEQGNQKRSTLVDDMTCPQPPVAPPAGLLYEPDVAVLRAGLVAELANQLNAAQLDPNIAYLTTDQLHRTPFARVWKMLEWLPFHLKRLRARLRSYDVGNVTVKKRGSPLDTDALARQLKGPGPHALVVVLTHVNGKPAVLICQEFAHTGVGV